MTSNVQPYPQPLAVCLEYALGAGGLIIERQDFVQANRDGQVILQANRLSSGQWSVYNMGLGRVTHHLISDENTAD